MSEYRSLGSGSDDFDALLTFFRGQYKANVNAGTPMSTRLWEEFKEDASLASSFIAGATADHLERSNMAKENTWFDDTMAVMENIPAVGKLAAATGLSAAMLMKISTKAGGIGRGYFKQGGMVKGGMSAPKGFTVDTTIPNFEDALRKPNYFRDEKNISVRRVMMPPDDYIKQASEGFGKSIEYVTSQRDPKLIKQYADDMLKGDKFPAASLDYDKYGFSQEGLHRALAAKQAGISEIPVSIRTAHRHEFPPKPTEQEVTSRYVNDLLDEELAERSLDEWMSTPKGFTSATTDMPYYDDLINKPSMRDYFKEQKGIEYDLLNMSPDDYLNMVDKGFDNGVMVGVDNEKVLRYAEKIRKGEEFPALTLDYARGKKLSQEGRHRALAAQKAGINEVPVVVVTPTPEEAKYLGANVPLSDLELLGYGHNAPSSLR